MPAPKHIAVVGFSTASHVYPSLALIRELVARGHRVSYAIGDRLAGLVESTGAELVTHPSTLPPDDADWPTDVASVMATRLFLNEAIVVLPRLLERYRHDRPDLVLYDIGGIAGPVLGSRLGVPSVLLTPANVAWEGLQEEIAAELGALEDAPEVRSYHQACNEWLRENGINQDAWEWAAGIQDVIALFPRVLQPHADRVPASVRFIGPCLDPVRLADRSWAPPAGDDRRVLLVSLGTLFNGRLDVFRSCLEAFADSGWQVVMAVGKRVNPADLGPIPPNVEVHPSIPQLAVLASASAFITHAGMASCSEALWFGVPTIAIPQAVDQFRNAAMLEALGVGCQLSAADQLSPAALRGAVESVAGASGLAGRLAEVRAEVRAQGGVAHAVAAVESFLA
jgi:MGT family glycosyltransferase